MRRLAASPVREARRRMKDTIWHWEHAVYLDGEVSPSRLFWRGNKQENEGVMNRLEQPVSCGAAALALAIEAIFALGEFIELNGD